MKDTELTEKLAYLYNQGKYYHAFRTFGAHRYSKNKADGYCFTVWAPDVKSVRVVGEHNDWREDAEPLSMIGTTGIWTGFVSGIETGMQYKYLLETNEGKLLYKADPYAFFSELRPGTASIAYECSYEWKDRKWMQRRSERLQINEPVNIYEVHPGSWKRHKDPDLSLPGNEEGKGQFYTYTEMAGELISYVRKMGYTHIELLPVMEHPYDGSWGYQVTGYYAPTSRYGRPEELMYLIDKAHRAGIGVILDWVPGHFCRDAHGLGLFNGKALYEGADHPQWGTYRFDFSRSEVRSFLISNAVYWLEVYHVDGLRVDGVTSMLYRNFGISGISSEEQDKTDPHAISFLREFNTVVHTYYPWVMTIAEESTAWPHVTGNAEHGGLGFDRKWDMGWMNDTLKYFEIDFSNRNREHRLLTFSMMYAYSEKFILPLSHDEVVHGKYSLIGRMPGDYDEKFAGLRLLFLLQMVHPGYKLSFMGNEFGQFIEWRDHEELEWFLLNYESHASYLEYSKALNHLYRKEKYLWSCDDDLKGFLWIEPDNAEQSVISLIRRTASGRSMAVAVLNFRNKSYEQYRIGVPKKGIYTEILSSDETRFGGNGRINPEPLQTQDIPFHGMNQSIQITVPALGGMILKYRNKGNRQ